MPTIGWIVVLLVVLAVGAGAGYFVGYNNRKKTAEAQIGSAEAEARPLTRSARKRFWKQRMRPLN